MTGSLFSLPSFVKRNHDAANSLCNFASFHFDRAARNTSTSGPNDHPAFGVPFFFSSPEHTFVNASPQHKFLHTSVADAPCVPEFCVAVLETCGNTNILHFCRQNSRQVSVDARQDTTDGLSISKAVFKSKISIKVVFCLCVLTIDASLGPHMQPLPFRRLLFFMYCVHQDGRVPLGEHSMSRRPFESSANTRPPWTGTHLLTLWKAQSEGVQSRCPRWSALTTARQRKQRTYPELSGRHRRCRLVILATETGGRWSLVECTRPEPRQARATTPAQESGTGMADAVVVYPFVHCCSSSGFVPGALMVSGWAALPAAHEVEAEQAFAGLV